ncbi:MAG TPA: outer membrane beta-barrel protein [Gemmatimonadota bacterium]|nr:outer membrane beta-barrel protein [Gemmatimonadota bacterium]
MRSSDRGSSWSKWMGALVALALVAAPAGLSAQMGGMSRDARLSVNPRVGVTVPGSNLSDLYKVAPSAGVGLGYWMTPRFGVVVNADVDFLNGKNTADAGINGGVPDMRLWEFTGGLAARLTPPATSRWDVTAQVGAGFTQMDTDSSPFFLLNQSSDSFSQGYFSAQGGLQVGYDIQPGVDLWVGGRANLILTKEEDTMAFAPLSDNVAAAGFDKAWTFPVRLGLRVRF